jgi:hypothetical protein
MKFKLPIDFDAVPIAHKSPYRPTDTVYVGKDIYIKDGKVYRYEPMFDELVLLK